VTTGEGQGLDGDFTAAYLAVRRVADLVDRDPAAVAPGTVSALETLLARDDHARQTQARILYRDAAGVLTALAADGPGHLARASRQALERALATPGKPRLAAAEAVGGLPLCLRGPVLDFPDPDPAPVVSFAALAALADAVPDAPPRVAGRGLLLATRHPDSLLVLKRLRRGEDPAGLVREAVWMRACAELPFPAPCHVPRPLWPGGQALAAVPDAPAVPGAELDPGGRCLAYLADRRYFAYPNDPPGAGGPDEGTFVEVMGRAALLLGWLAGRGIVHEAAIPLFHNRVQRDRREDGGVYDWRLPGRLDRWLASALHPNFGLSGLRDFEHLASLERASRLYRRMGDHFVSLFLVAGSYFRQRDPGLRGLTDRGEPVDARHLFDEARLTEVVAAVVDGYHRGFVGAPPAVAPFCPRALARRMVEEMGVDRYMTEILRVADQEAMTDAAFAAFCLARGLDPETARSLTRGAADVTLVTGPHLGAFNDRTSLPELAECTAAASAACLIGRYFADRGRN
jgi:hypothetical protein